MHTSNFHLGRRRFATTGSDGDHGLLIAGGVLAVVTAVAFLQADPLALPLLSVALVLPGFALAGFVLAWRFFHNGETGTAHQEQMSGLIDLSGLIVFFGFAAAILSDPNAVVQSLQMYR